MVISCGRHRGANSSSSTRLQSGGGARQRPSRNPLAIKGQPSGKPPFRSRPRRGRCGGTASGEDGLTPWPRTCLCLPALLAVGGAVEVEATVGGREIGCLSCGAPLNAWEGQRALKYFRVKRGRASASGKKKAPPASLATRGRGKMALGRYASRPTSIPPRAQDLQPDTAFHRGEASNTRIDCCGPVRHHVANAPGGSRVTSGAPPADRFGRTDVWLALMDASTPIPYECPNCGTRYKVVPVETPAKPGGREIICVSCGAPLNARQGKFALKYFRVRPPPKRDQRFKT
jgi:hypothetical protein